MFDISNINVPLNWKDIPIANLSGVIMVIGASDVGKSTFARYLYNQIYQSNIKSAFLDGDPGQATLGPPATITLALSGNTQGGEQSNRSNVFYRYFIGSVSPRGHMLNLLVGASKLVNKAHELGVKCVIYDTTGLVNPLQGGYALKHAKISLFAPRYIIGIQHECELEPILMPIQRSQRSQVILLATSKEVKSRDLTDRQAYRQVKFREYFLPANRITIKWNDFPLFPYPRVVLNQLIGFEDKEGLLLSLGINLNIERDTKKVTVLTPLKSLDNVNAIQMGDLIINPENFRDKRMET